MNLDGIYDPPKRLGVILQWVYIGFFQPHFPTKNWISLIYGGHYTAHLAGKYCELEDNRDILRKWNST